MDRQKAAIAEEAARIVCDEARLDYLTAKQKAVRRLGLLPRSALPDNACVHGAVRDYLRLFGGTAYRQRLQRFRAAAPRLMRELSTFTPRLTGGTVDGALVAASRMQLHLFAEPAELVELHLLERGLRFEQDERSYRYPDGHSEIVPLVRFEFAELGVDAAVFADVNDPRVPLSPLDGRRYTRLDLSQAERLASSEIEIADH